MRRPFNLQGYQFLSVASITVNSGERVEDLGLSGAKLPEAGNPTETFQLDAMPSYYPGSDMIRLENLEIDLLKPVISGGILMGKALPSDGPYVSRIQLLETTLNMKNGDTVIVGGSNIEGRSYVLVLTAKTVWKEETGGPVVIPAPDTIRFDGSP